MKGSLNQPYDWWTCWISLCKYSYYIYQFFSALIFKLSYCKFQITFQIVYATFITHYWLDLCSFVIYIVTLNTRVKFAKRGFYCYMCYTLFRFPSFSIILSSYCLPLIKRLFNELNDENNRWTKEQEQIIWNSCVYIWAYYTVNNFMRNLW